MPAGEPGPAPSAAMVAWNWIVEELADCKEFDSSVLAALMRWNRRTVADPFYGGRTMKRLALKYVEELIDPAEFLPPLPSDAIALSSVDILYHYSQGVEGSSTSTTQNCAKESYRDSIRQIILQKRASLYKSSLDLLKDLLVENCRQGVSSLTSFSYVERENKRDCLLTCNDDTHGTSKKLKLNSDHIPEVNLLSAIFSKSNQNFPVEGTTAGCEQPLSEQNVQAGVVDHNACSMETLAPECAVEKDEMIHDSSELKTVVNSQNVQGPDASCDHGLRASPYSLSHSEGYYDAALNFHLNDEVIAVETLKLLNSQNSVNDDCQMGDWTEKALCCKCKEGGQLLTCSVNGCSIAVHESCMRPSIDTGNPYEFKCPICLYLLAASDYYKARKKFFYARKNMDLFMPQDVELKKVSIPCSVEGSSRARNTSEKCQLEMVCARKRCEIRKESNRQNQVEVALVGKDTTLTAELGNILDNMNNDSSLGERVANQHHLVNKFQQQELAFAAVKTDGCGQHQMPLFEMKEQTNKDDGDLPTVTIQPDDNSPSLRTQDNELSGRSSSLGETHRLKHQQQGDSDTDSISLPFQRICDECEKERKRNVATEHVVNQQNSPKILISEQSCLKVGRRSASRSKLHTNSTFRSPRRNRLPWTSEEEATLKEAMQKFYPDTETNVSWIKILEFGSHIFHKTRQPMDLKGKWRNIKRGAEQEFEENLVMSMMK